ncbi:sugar phosphate isomerase/epimerase family protein [Ructibacterium gallinarum]|uniref:Sugar phosphate isomerase/epimerase n=1 Tax=Ructibacterium gallinarum TaxID=2779355 RepID=A0A9D5M084_9FIRM|nr:sugar phosphate isomerase/epimerase family protein [Ructibacterium gallinarum]MBE5039756.1 sugar phosphate isomerase/epimerase [Ructibacterium gallinarum]
MNQFIISGFSDEIDPSIDRQFAHLKKLGISYFEPRNVDGKNISELTEEEAYALKKKMDAEGIKVSSIGSPIGKIQITDDFEPHFQLLLHVMKLAKILDTAYIRIFSFFIPKGENPEKYREEVMHRMRRMTEAAEKENIILLHENEKEIYGDVAIRCKDILDTVNSPNLRAVFDPANFIQCGQKVFPEAYALLRPYVVYMHIKDALKDGKVVPAGMGEGSIAELLSALKDSGYQGFLSLEPHLGEFEGLSALENGDLMKGLEKSTPDKFTLAHRSLVQILERMDA